MAAHHKPEESEWVEVRAHARPPPYEHVFPESSTDALLRQLLDKMDRMESRLEKMTTELEHVKFNTARNFIMDIIKTKEFMKTIATCIDSNGKLDSDKFIKMVEAAEPGGLASLIRKLMMDSGITNAELKDVLLTYEPPAELQKEWSAMKKGFVGATGTGCILLALVALFAPTVLGGVVVAGAAAAVCGLVCAGGAVLMK